MITGYVELATETEADDLEIEIAEKYAASVGKDYPIPPDVVGPGLYPCDLREPTPFANLTPEQQEIVFKQAYYIRALRYDDGKGGVIAIDDVLDQVPDLELASVAKEDLSAKAKTLLDAADVR